MPDYSIKLYDDEIMSFRAEKHYDEISIEILSVTESMRHLFPYDLHPNHDSILHWLRRRVIPKNRAFVEEILHSLGLQPNDTLGIIDVCKGLSLNDSFWVVPRGFDGSFSDYNLYENPFSEVLSIIAYTGYGSTDQAFHTSPELTTDGMLPKAWPKRNDGIYLYKGGSTGAANAGNEPYSEYYSAQIARAMGVNAISYDLERWRGILASTCKLFTDIDISYVSMARMIENVSLRKTLEFASSQGEDFVEQLHSMLIFDALIRNEDRHFGNFGVLRDNRSGNILSPAPLFDHGLGLFSQAFGIELTSADKLLEFADAFTPFYDNVSTRDICDIAMGKQQIQQLHHLIDFHFTKHALYNWPDERLHVTEQCIKARAIQLYNLSKDLHKSSKVFIKQPARMADQLAAAQEQAAATHDIKQPEPERSIPASR